MHSGWNWMALGVDPIEKNPAVVFDPLTSWSTIVKNKSNSIVYSNGVEWNGTLRSIEPAVMYKLKLQRLQNSKELPSQVPISGRQIKVDELPIALSEGWNWIAYTPLTTMTVDEALAGANPKKGDRIKSHAGQKRASVIRRSASVTVHTRRTRQLFGQHVGGHPAEKPFRDH